MSITADRVAAGNLASARSRVRQIAENRGMRMDEQEVIQLARAAMAAGHFDTIRTYVDRWVAGRLPAKPGGVRNPDAPTGKFEGGQIPGGGSGRPKTYTPPDPAAPPTAEEPKVDFYEEARRQFPWLPPALLREYARGWAATADPGLAWGYVRDSEVYGQFFAGNKREDGTFRMSEQEYMATKDGYRQTLADYGLNTSLFDGKFVSLIEGDVSLQEFGQRLDAANSQIVGNIPAVQEWYSANYGIALTPEAIFASFIDPDIGSAVLERRITTAQIGGEAQARGFTRSISDAERLAAAGLTQDQARQLYGAAETRLPTLNALAGRYNDADPDYGIGEFEDAALGDTGEQQRQRRLVGAEQSAFTGGGRRIAEDQSGGLSGLKAR